MSTLIAYATKYGSVEKSTKMLSEKLEGNIDFCNLKQEKNVDLAKYDKVIIGGSIYVGRVQKEITKFCTDNLDALMDKKLGLFICCMATGDKAEGEFNGSFPQDLIKKAVAKANFGGDIEYKRMNFLDKFVTKMVSKADDKNFLKLDENHNLSAISEETVERFAKLMNEA